MPTPDGRLNEVEPDWFDLPDLREPPSDRVAVDAALFGAAAPAGAEVATVAREMQSPAETEPAVLPLVVDEDGAVGSGDDERARRRALVAAAVLALLAMVGTTLGVMAFTGSDASQPAVEIDRDVTTAPTPTTTSPPTTTPETAPPSSNPPTASSVPTRRAPTTTRSVPPARPGRDPGGAATPAPARPAAAGPVDDDDYDDDDNAADDVSRRAPVCAGQLGRTASTTRPLPGTNRIALGLFP